MKKAYKPGQYLHPSIESVRREVVGKSISHFNYDSADDIDEENLPVFDEDTVTDSDSEVDDASSESVE